MCSSISVIPAKAGIHKRQGRGSVADAWHMEPRLREDDGRLWSGTYQATAILPKWLPDS